MGKLLKPDHFDSLESYGVMVKALPNGIAVSDVELQ